MFWRNIYTPSRVDTLLENEVNAAIIATVLFFNAGMSCARSHDFAIDPLIHIHPNDCVYLFLCLKYLVCFPCLVFEV